MSEERIEDHLSNGLQMILVPDPMLAPRAGVRTSVEGWSVGKYLILRVELGRDRSRTFRSGSTARLCFMDEGIVFTASARLMDFHVTEQKPTMRVVWPEILSANSMREFTRAPLNSPGHIVSVDSSPFDGFVTDVGEGGCAIRSMMPANEGDRIACSFALPDGSIVDGQVAVVKNVRESGNQRVLGCQFEDLEDKVRSDIELFVASAMVGSRKAHSSTILVVGTESSEAHDLGEALRPCGYTVSYAIGAIEAFAKLHSQRPPTILVSTAQADLSAAQIASTIRATPFFANVRIATYGEEDGNRTPHSAKHYGDLTAPDVIEDIMKSLGFDTGI